jgi:hypothetical protein
MAASKQFYLLGEDPVTSSKEIDISSVSDEDDLRHTIAAHFAIVQSSGMMRLVPRDASQELY